MLVLELPRHIHVKIVDFGIARYVNKGEIYKTRVIGSGTAFWRAPEILASERAYKLSKPDLKAADVYSFAMTCYEVLTGERPLSNLGRTEYDRVMEGYRPTLPAVHLDLKVLIEQCWHGELDQRPNFDSICEKIQRIEMAL